MRYLECIEMLTYLLKKVYAGQRKQVPVTTCNEVQEVVIQVQKKLENDLQPREKAIIRDLLNAVNLALDAQGMLNLTDTMKTSIVEGIQDLYDAIAIKAYEYYKTNDFEPTDEIIPIMRKVVEVAVRKGAFV